MHNVNSLATAWAISRTLERKSNPISLKTTQILNRVLWSCYEEMRLSRPGCASVPDLQELNVDSSMAIYDTGPAPC